MSDKNPHSSAELKKYKSTIKEQSNEHYSQLAQNIFIRILKKQFNEAQQMCRIHNFKLLSKITRLCFQFNLLKYVLLYGIEKEKQSKLLNSGYLSQQFLSILKQAIKYKQLWRKNKNYFQEIDISIQQLLIQNNFDCKLTSGDNENLSKIKNSLFKVNIFISNLKGQISKLKAQNTSLKQSKIQCEKSIKKLNKVIERTKIQIQTDREQNLTHVRSKHNLEKEMQVLKAQKCEFQRNFEQKLKIKQQQISKLLLYKKQLELALNQLNTSKEMLQNQRTLQNQQKLKRNKEQEEEKNAWVFQRKKYKEELKQKNDTVNSLIQELQCSNDIVLDMQLQHKVNKQTIKELTAKIQQLESKCQLLNNQIAQNFVNHQAQTSNFSQQVADLQLQKQQLTSKLTDQYHWKSNLISKMDQIQIQLQKQREQKISFGKRSQYLDQENQKLNYQVNHLTEQLQKMNQDYLQAESLIQELKLDRQKLLIEVKDQGINTLLNLDDLNQIQNRIVEDQQIIKNYKQKITLLNQNLLKIQQIKDQNGRKYQQVQSSYTKILRDIDLSKIQRKDLFFIGRILGQQPEGRQYLQSAIQRAQRKTIRKTILLYQLDILNKTNFHKYIDNVPNIVVLIKTLTGWIVSGYSQGPFFPKMVSNKNGLIISVSARQCFGLRVPNKRAVAYDDFFLIFGNSQIRIKSQDFKLFSNFAISSSYYDNREHKVQMVTGEKGVRQVLIQYVQVFQLEFY